MKSNLIILLLTLTLLSCQQQTAQSVQTIEPATFAGKLKSSENAQLIDVRTPGEFASDHLDNAANIDWNGADFNARAEKLDKTKPVFVYCKSGGRSASAANRLSELGFAEVYNMDGGIMKWNSGGYGKADKKRTGMSQAEFAKLIASEDRVLVNFSAEWCAPCKVMKPYLVKMQEELKDTVTIIRLDADAQKSLMAEMKLDGLPMLLLYEKNKLIWKHAGYISESDLKKQL